jgi:hypothetical protein
VTLPDFDYKAQAAQLEVPRRDRIAAIRKRKREERGRARITPRRLGGSARSEAVGPGRNWSRRRPGCML